MSTQVSNKTPNGQFAKQADTAIEEWLTEGGPSEYVTPIAAAGLTAAKIFAHRIASQPVSRGATMYPICHVFTTAVPAPTENAGGVLHTKCTTMIQLFAAPDSTTGGPESAVDQLSNLGTLITSALQAGIREPGDGTNVNWGCAWYINAGYEPEFSEPEFEEWIPWDAAEEILFPKATFDMTWLHRDDS